LELLMKRFIAGEDRSQITLLPECLDDYIGEDNPVRVIDGSLRNWICGTSAFKALERGAQRNVELMWLTGRLAPDFETIADFRRDNGTGIRNVCRRFIMLCRDLRLFSQAVVAIDSSKFKAVNSRDRNFTPNKIERRRQQIEESIRRYLEALQTADRTQPVETKQHLIVTHEVTNVGSDRAQLTKMANDSA
jgi:transposase